MDQDNTETEGTEFENARETLKGLTQEEKELVVDYLTKRIRAVVLVTARDVAEQTVNKMLRDLDSVLDREDMTFNIRVGMKFADLLEAAGHSRQVSWGMPSVPRQTFREANDSRLKDIPIDKPFWINLWPWIIQEHDQSWHLSLTTKRGGGVGKGALSISLTVNDLLEFVTNKAPEKRGTTQND